MLRPGLALSLAAASTLALAPPSGELPQRLTDHPAEDRAPSWSPDGRWIAYAARAAEGEAADIYLVAAGGATQSAGK